MENFIIDARLNDRGVSLKSLNVALLGASPTYLFYLESMSFPKSSLLPTETTNSRAIINML